MRLNSRYAAAGFLNGLIGLSAIWGLTMLGAHPVPANVLGYAAALSVGFLGARKFVFRSQGHLTPEAIRYFGSFVLCFSVNVAVLYLCVAHYALGHLLSQGLAVGSYVVSMYLCSRLFVFQGKPLE